MNKVSAKYSGQALAMVAALFALPGCHSQKATVLPKGGNAFEVVAQSSNEETAFRRAESEARYTCEERDKQFIVKNKDSVYQGADKNARGDVNGGNVALAIFTGKTGKEGKKDDYKVTLLIECE